MVDSDMTLTAVRRGNLEASKMAEYGEWVRKGAVLSEVTAQKEYGLTRDFIVEGIQAGILEFREGAVWGNPYLRVLRSQLEGYIAQKVGSEYLLKTKSQIELRAINKEIAELKKKLSTLEARKVALGRARRRRNEADRPGMQQTQRDTPHSGRDRRRYDQRRFYSGKCRLLYTKVGAAPGRARISLRGAEDLAPWAQDGRQHPGQDWISPGNCGTVSGTTRSVA